MDGLVNLTHLELIWKKRLKNGYKKITALKYERGDFYFPYVSLNDLTCSI